MNRHWLPATLATAVPLAVMLLAGCNHESVASPAAHTAAVAAPPAVAVQPAAPGTSNSAPPAAETLVAAPAKPPSAGQLPPADRTPRRPGEPEKISFDDLNIGMNADMVFRPFLLTDRVKELDGQRVSIIGYMHGGVEATRGIKEFILLKNSSCKFGPGGQADHLAQVYLEAGHAVDFTGKPVKVEGTLKVSPVQGADQNTWAIYQLEKAQVVR